jgi:hypothetical protein
MELERALHQISQIHEHLAKSEVYRGYRAVPIGLSGVVAMASAVVQRKVIPAGSVDGYLTYWVAVAFLGGIVAGGGIIYNYFFVYDSKNRKKSRTVVGQMLPSLLAGVIVTLLVAEVGREYIRILPGMWAILFSLGIFASRPYLPKNIGFVALFYLVAGTFLLMCAADGVPLSPWGMGLTFGIGQIAAAIVLYWDIERKENGSKV